MAKYVTNNRHVVLLVVMFVVLLVVLFVVLLGVLLVVLFVVLLGVLLVVLLVVLPDDFCCVCGAGSGWFLRVVALRVVVLPVTVGVCVSGSLPPTNHFNSCSLK